MGRVPNTGCIPWRGQKNIGFAAHELNEMADIVDNQRDKIERAWHEHFGD